MKNENQSMSRLLSFSAMAARLDVAESDVWQVHNDAELSVDPPRCGIAIILVIFGLIRPLFKNLSQAGELVRERQSMAIADMTQLREAAMQEAVPGLPTPITLDPDDSEAAKMETVRNLISEDPERVAQVVKHWVTENE